MKNIFRMILLLVVFNLMTVESIGQRHRIFTNLKHATAINFISDSSINVEIILPLNVTKDDAESANFLAQCLAKIAKSGNIKVSHFLEKHSQDSIKIYLEKQKSKSVEFRISKSRISIKYPDSKNANYAVSNFLTKYCGVALLAPLPLGLEADKFSNLTLKSGIFKIKPSWNGFVFCDFYSEKNLQWQKLNTFDNQVCHNFSHNFDKILANKTPAKEPNLFGDLEASDGSFYPSKRCQPNFASDELVDFTVEYIKDFFLKNPSNQIVSIGMNDTQLVSQNRNDLKFKNGYFRDYPNWSNLYFYFANKVSEKLSTICPNKQLGCLAYLIFIDTPNFKVASNIVPFVATDRANYCDNDFKNKDFGLMQRWADSGIKNFGIYDYMYGTPYIFPRETSEYSIDGIEQAYKLGARFYFAEIFAQWGYDAKKLWVVAKKLEDNSRKFSDLEEEFYLLYYKDAADYMRQFFDVSKRVWSKPRKTRWLRFYKSESQLDMYSNADILAMESALINAENISASTSEIVSKRVREARLLFDVSLAAYNAYSLKKELWHLCWNSNSVSKILAKYQDLQLALSHLKKVTQIQNQQTLFYPVTYDFLNSDIYSPFDLIAQKILKLDYNLAKNLIEENEYIYNAFELSYGKIAVANQNFNYSTDTDITSLGMTKYSLDFFNQQMGIVANEGIDGSNCFKFENAISDGIGNNYNVSAQSICRLQGYFKGQISAGSMCYAYIVFCDANNTVTGSKTLLFPTGKHSNFNEFVLTAHAPEKTVSAIFSIYATRQLSNDILYIDNINITCKNKL